MRLAHFLILLGIPAAICCRAVAATYPAESPHDLLKEVIYNELQDRESDSFWQYKVERKTPREDLTEMQVETKYGPIYRIVATGGRPLSESERRDEDARLDGLLHSSSEQARVEHQYEQDEGRLQRMMRMMPDAFTCDYDGLEQDGNVVRLKFRPNPSFDPPTFEARIFHSLAGTLWINLLQKRMFHLQGQILDRVDFGYGLLGRIEKGGTFEIQREPVSQTHWKTDLVNIHVTGKLILFKSITKDQRELRSGFKPVPTGITLQQAKGLLDQIVQVAGASGPGPQAGQVQPTGR
jgi:hypothetical protein